MPRQSAPLLTLSARPTAAVAAHRAVGFDDEQADTAGQRVKGVATHAVLAGELLALDAVGTTVVETGGEFSAGDKLTVDANGRAVVAAALTIAAGVTAVTSAAANGAGTIAGAVPPVVPFATALKPSTGAGQFVEVLLTP